MRKSSILQILELPAPCLPPLPLNRNTLLDSYQHYKNLSLMYK